MGNSIVRLPNAMGKKLLLFFPNVTQWVLDGYWMGIMKKLHVRFQEMKHLQEWAFHFPKCPRILEVWIISPVQCNIIVASPFQHMSVN